jgi:hypothetical protein
VNENLLYIVARHNFDRIYGDGRFDWIDDDWTLAVVTEGARLHGRERVHDHAVQHDHGVGATAPAKRKQSRSKPMKKINAALKRLRKVETK